MEMRLTRFNKQKSGLTVRDAIGFVPWKLGMVIAMNHSQKKFWKDPSVPKTSTSRRGCHGRCVKAMKCSVLQEMEDICWATCAACWWYESTILYPHVGLIAFIGYENQPGLLAHVSLDEIDGRTRAVLPGGHGYWLQELTIDEQSEYCNARDKFHSRAESVVATCFVLPS